MRISDWSSDVCSSDLLWIDVCSSDLRGGEILNLPIDAVVVLLEEIDAGLAFQSAVPGVEGKAQFLAELAVVLLAEARRFDLRGRVDRVAEEGGDEIELHLAQRGERGQRAKGQVQIHLARIGLDRPLHLAVDIGVHDARVGVRSEEHTSALQS